jgi:hypothetical protein
MPVSMPVSMLVFTAFLRHLHRPSDDPSPARRVALSPVVVWLLLGFAAVVLLVLAAVVNDWRRDRDADRS